MDLPQPLTGLGELPTTELRGLLSSEGDARQQPIHFLGIATSWRFACSPQHTAGYPAPILGDLAYSAGGLQTNEPEGSPWKDLELNSVVAIGTSFGVYQNEFKS